MWLGRVSQCAPWRLCVSVRSGPEVDNPEGTHLAMLSVRAVGRVALRSSGCQAMAQVVPAWVRPIVRRRSRFDAVV